MGTSPSTPDPPSTEFKVGDRVVWAGMPATVIRLGCDWEKCRFPDTCIEIEFDAPPNHRPYMNRSNVNATSLAPLDGVTPP